MGLFDKMFGRGASTAQQQPNAQQRFNELKGKYQSVLNLVEHQRVQLLNLHVQDNKLFIKGTAPSDSAKDSVWNQIKLVDSGYDKDLTADITVDASRAVGEAAGGGRVRVKPMKLSPAIICRRSASSFTEIQTSTCGSSMPIATNLTIPTSF